MRRSVFGALVLAGLFGMICVPGVVSLPGTLVTAHLQALSITDMFA